MLAGQGQIAVPFSPMGLAMSPTLCLHMLHLLSIVIGKGLRALVAIASLEGQPCWLQLTLVSHTIFKKIDLDSLFWLMIYFSFYIQLIRF